MDLPQQKVFCILKKCRDYTAITVLEQRLKSQEHDNRSRLYRHKSRRNGLQRHINRS